MLNSYNIHPEVKELFEEYFQYEVINYCQSNNKNYNDLTFEEVHNLKLIAKNQTRCDCVEATEMLFSKFITD